MSIRKPPKTDPHILELPPQKMAIVQGKGAPDEIFPTLAPALYGSVYTLKFDLKKKGLPTFKVSKLRARYPNAPLVPKKQWTIIIALPVPKDTTSLPQKIPGIKVELETWSYGTIGQILHLGAYDREEASITRLHQYINGNGYELAGVHEEEYLTTPNAKISKTLIRYPVKKN
jgi:hypothetical protein